MKIGILSMHRVPNYGSFWQAYCLMKMLEKSGNDVDFIDIRKGRQILDTPLYKRSFSLTKIKRIPYYLFQKKKLNIFQHYQAKKLGCAERMNYRTNYDCIIIGSDEVFNCIQQSPWGFSTQLYGAMDNDNVNSYAGSFGYTTMENIEKYGLSEEISQAIKNMRNISVRDLNSEQIMSELSDGKQIQRHLDPVLIGDLPVPKAAVCNKQQKYIVIYAYDFRFHDEAYISCIKAFAQKKGLKIYSVGFYQDWVDKNIVTDPYTLLEYFKNAEYIITDTFHGTIFSIRCKKKFVTVVRDTNRQKLTSLLESVNLSNRIVTKPNEIALTLNKDIQYDDVFKILKKERKRTEDYLKACIQKGMSEINI